MSESRYLFIYLRFICIFVSLNWYSLTIFCWVICLFLYISAIEPTSDFKKCFCYCIFSILEFALGSLLFSIYLLGLFFFIIISSIPNCFKMKKIYVTLILTEILCFGSQSTSQVQTSGPGPLCGPWFKFQFHFQSLGSAALVCPTVCGKPGTWMSWRFSRLYKPGYVHKPWLLSR